MYLEWLFLGIESEKCECLVCSALTAASGELKMATITSSPVLLIRPHFMSWAPSSVRLCNCGKEKQQTLYRSD